MSESLCKKKKNHINSYENNNLNKLYNRITISIFCHSPFFKFCLDTKMELLCSPFIPADLPEIIDEGTSYPLPEYEPFNYEDFLAGPSDVTKKLPKKPVDFFESTSREDDYKYSLPLTYGDLVKPKGYNKSIDAILWITVLFYTMNEAMLGWFLYLFLAFAVIIGCKILLPKQYLPSLYTKSPILFWSTLFALIVCAPNIFNLNHTTALGPAISPLYQNDLLTLGPVQNASVEQFSDLIVEEYGICPALKSDTCISPYYNLSSSLGFISSVSNSTRNMKLKRTKKVTLENTRHVSLKGSTKTTSQAPTKTAPSTMTMLDSSFETRDKETKLVNKFIKVKDIFNDTDNVKSLFDQYYQMELDLRTKRWDLMEELSKVESELKSVTFYTVPDKKLISARVGNYRL